MVEERLAAARVAALYKLALSRERLGGKEAARTTLEALVKRFPYHWFFKVHRLLAVAYLLLSLLAPVA